VIVAFHFRAIEEQYSPTWVLSVQAKVFRAFAGLGHSVHAEVYCGDLLVSAFSHDAFGREAVLDSFRNLSPRRMQTLEVEKFTESLFSERVFVVSVKGLNKVGQDQVDKLLRSTPDYLGAVEIDPGDPIQWRLYRRGLIRSFRYVDQGIRLFYPKFEEGANSDVKDNTTADAFRALGFRVSFEDSGVSRTIFDPYHTFEHSKREALLEAYVSLHLSGLTEEIMLRLATADPRQIDTLYSAFKALERIETVEDVAQVAVSCRRYLEGLANILYPPRTGLVQGRKVTKDAYRNRLWAYITEKLGGTNQNLAFAQLDDIGHRIDAIDSLSNKGIHGRVQRLDIERLLVALVTLTYDLFSLTLPPTEASYGPYDESVRQVIIDLLNTRPESTD
jgi:hypothetical protein